MRVEGGCELITGSRDGWLGVRCRRVWCEYRVCCSVDQLTACTRNAAGSGQVSLGVWRLLVVSRAAVLIAAPCTGCSGAALEHHSNRTDERPNKRHTYDVRCCSCPGCQRPIS